MYGAGADPIWSEPESAPKPRTSGAGTAQKSAGSATLKTGVQLNIEKFLFNTNKFFTKKNYQEARVQCTLSKPATGTYLHRFGSLLTILRLCGIFSLNFPAGVTQK